MNEKFYMLSMLQNLPIIKNNINNVGSIIIFFIRTIYYAVKNWYVTSSGVWNMQS